MNYCQTNEARTWSTSSRIPGKVSEGVGFRVQGLGFEVLLFFGGLGLSRPSVISWGGGGGLGFFEALERFRV